jgi:hypothetical protein
MKVIYTNSKYNCSLLKFSSIGPDKLSWFS